MISRNILGYLCIALFSLTSLPAEGPSVLKTDARLLSGGTALPSKGTLASVALRAKKKAKAQRNAAALKAQYDYIIVGAGTAGAVIARRLSDDFNISVLVLEAGENLSNNPEVLDPNIFDNFVDLTFNPKFSLTYPVFLPIGTFQSTTYSAGRMWGGSSAHNYLLNVRGTAGIYDAWAKLSGNEEWNFDHVSQTFLDIETYTGESEDPDQRGTDGPIFVTQTSPVGGNPFADSLARALKAPLQQDYNVTPQGDVCTSTWQQYVTPGPDSERSFSITGYLPNGSMPDPILTFDGEGLDGRDLRVVSSAAVSRVIFKNNKAVGVEYILSPDTEEVLTAYATQKIILCAGAINSTAILQRSGIGDAGLLESLGIPVIFDNPNVGQHLANQYGPNTLMTGNNSQFLQAMATGFPFFPNDGIRRLQFLFFPGTLVSGDNFILDTKSRGFVSIVSANPLIYPDVQFNMFSDSDSAKPWKVKGSDAYAAVSICKLIKKIAKESGGEVLQPPPEAFASDALLFDYCLGNPGMTITDHITGTCRMAKSPRGKNGGVVDGFLNVFGVENLMVADLGVAPHQPDGNPCFPVYVIGNKAADFILSGH